LAARRGTGWHLQHARFVAAAAGRFAARPTMTGTTALLDPAGAVVDVAPPGPVALAVTARRRHPAWTGASVSPWVAAAALLALTAAARRGASPPQPT
jgi:apolipoprotein N-acyltransferase